MTQKPFAMKYPQVEALLTNLYQVPATGRVALMGRIKNLQRKGWPPGTNSGRGKPALYNAEALVQLLLALEFTALRIPPEQTVEILTDLDWALATSLCLSAFAHSAPYQDESAVFLAFDPDGLSPLKGDNAPPRAEWLSMPEDAARLDDFRAGRRFVSVNVSRLLADVVAAVEKNRGDILLDEAGLRRAWEAIKNFNPTAGLEELPDLSPEVREELARIKALFDERRS